MVRSKILGAAAAGLALGAGAAQAAPVASAADYVTVDGESKRVGSGATYRFEVQVQRSIDIRRKRFAAEVEGILVDDRSWTRSGAVAFKRVDGGGNTRVILAKPRQVQRLCYLQTRRYSCRIGEKVVVNLRRWQRGVPHWPDSRRNYRRMLVNHEMGHRIGHGDRNCPERGTKAPVMQQQSISLQGCRANWWPTSSELRATRSLNKSSAATAAAAASFLE